MSTKNFLITDRNAVRKEWGKTEADVMKDVEIIRTWFETQKHLPEVPTNNMIEFFLTNCKFSIEKTKKNLDMYYTIRDIMPDIYKGSHPCKTEEVQAAYNTADCIPLPKLTPLLYRVTLVKYRDVTVEDTDVRKLCSHVLSNLYEIRIHEDLVMGDVILVDYEFVKFGVIAKFTPLILKQCAQIFEKVQSNRLKALHLLYPPGFVDVIINIFKGFLSKKLQERIFVHKTLEDVYKCIPREILPSDYGGEEKSIDELTELWKNKLEEYKDRFDKLEKMKVNEAVRPEKLENDEILGYHGNFKKISLD